VFTDFKGGVEFHQHIVNRDLIPTQVKAGLVVGGKAKIHQASCLAPLLRFMVYQSASGRGLGLPPKVVQERWGHSSITMTYDRYGQLFPRGDDSEALERQSVRF
jgi:integrase